MLSLMFTEFVPIFARIVATFPKKETFSKKGDPICQKGHTGDPLKDSAEPCALAMTLNCRVVYFSVCPGGQKCELLRGWGKND